VGRRKNALRGDEEDDETLRMDAQSPVCRPEYTFRVEERLILGSFLTYYPGGPRGRSTAPASRGVARGCRQGGLHALALGRGERTRKGG